MALLVDVAVIYYRMWAPSDEASTICLAFDKACHDFLLG
jgi:hypothetical protein